MAEGLSKRQAMTRNWCNQTQSLALKTRTVSNKNYKLTILQGEHTVNRMSSSFANGGDSPTFKLIKCNLDAQKVNPAQKLTPNKRHRGLHLKHCLGTVSNLKLLGA